MNCGVNLTIKIEEDFDQLITKLKPLHFQLTSEGSLVWVNPFETTQKLTIKPFVEGSHIYNVNLIGSSENATAILKRALSAFKTEVRQLHYNIYFENYSLLDCREKAAAHWKEVNPRIFDCHITDDFKDLSCLLMEDKVILHTRSVKAIERVDKAISQCINRSQVFQETEPYDLFTFEMYVPEQTWKGNAECLA